MSGKLFTLTKRGNFFYARFKMPDGTWSTAKSTGETARARAERWAENYLGAGQVVVKENIYFGKFAGDFFNYNGEWAIDKRVSGKKNTPRQCLENTAILKNRLMPVFGNIKLTDINKSAIKDFRNNLYKQGFMGSTINKSLSCLKSILESAEEKSLIQFVPKVERAANRPKLRGIFTIPEVRHIFSAEWRDFRCYVANLAAACTGLRRGELMALTLQEIGDNYIAISHSWDQALGVMNESTKTGRSRTVIIPSNLKSEIDRLAGINPWGNPDSFLFFSSLERKPIEGRIISRELYRVLKDIGINTDERLQRNLTFHSWRHWFNSLLINAKIPLQKIQSVTGHLTAEMTQHYYHPDELGDIVDVVNSTLFPQGIK